MPMNIIITKIKKAQAGSILIRQLIAVIVAFMVFAAQTLPATASYDSHKNNSQIENCSGPCTKLIQQNDKKPQQNKNDDHCSFCVVSHSDSIDNSTPHLSIQSPSKLSTILYRGAQTTGLTGPEQYWSASRGPPIESINNNMTTPISLLHKKQTRVTLNAWGLSCF